jgi:hypothetical protein
MNDIEKEVRAEDIRAINKAGDPNIWREVADRFGVEVVIFISKKAEKTRLDVPAYKRLLAPALDRNLKITHL